MKKNLSIVILSTLVMGALSGCNIDVLEHGAKCPPEEENARISYIIYNEQVIGEKSDEFGIYFEKNWCPPDYTCALDDEKEFYCKLKCDEGLVACNGTCINPKTDNNYCGASNEGCNGYECCRNAVKCKSSEFCSKGKCVAKECEEDSCFNGVLFKCDNGASQKGEDCPTGVCENDTQCRVASCEIGEKLCQHGSIHECLDGKKWDTKACESGICNEDGKTCSTSKCSEDERTCSNNILLVCKNGRYEEQYCGKGENCVNGKCMAASEICTVSRCIDTGDSVEFRECVNGVPQNSVTCKSNETCVVTKGCVECTENERKCDNQVYFKCNKDSKWEIVQDCKNSGQQCSTFEEGGCYTCKDGEKNCTSDGIHRVCEKGIWIETNCAGMSCDDNNGCYECKNGDTKCDILGVYYACENYRWVKKEDCSARKMACLENKGCYNCSGSEKRCSDGAYMKCVNGQFEVIENCALSDTKNKCSDNKGCYECDPGEKECSNGVYKTCNSNTLMWESVTCQSGQICDPTAGCKYENKCNADHTIYTRYYGNTATQEFCALDHKYCDDVKGCVDADVSCESGNNYMMKITSQESKESTFYDCRKNSVLQKESEYMDHYDEIVGSDSDIESKTLCNPKFGCATFYCDVNKNIAYTSYYGQVEGDDCSFMDEKCSNSVYGCNECDPDNFKNYCDDDRFYIGCKVENDTVTLVEDDECEECKGDKCTKYY